MGRLVDDHVVAHVGVRQPPGPACGSPPQPACGSPPQGARPSTPCIFSRLALSRGRHVAGDLRRCGGHEDGGGRRCAGGGKQRIWRGQQTMGASANGPTCNSAISIEKTACSGGRIPGHVGLALLGTPASRARPGWIGQQGGNQRDACGSDQPRGAFVDRLRAKSPAGRAVELHEVSKVAVALRSGHHQARGTDLRLHGSAPGTRAAEKGQLLIIHVLIVTCPGSIDHKLRDSPTGRACGLVAATWALDVRWVFSSCRRSSSVMTAPWKRHCQVNATSVGERDGSHRHGRKWCPRRR